MRAVYFITHPNVIIDPAIPVPEWPLSPRGVKRMKALLAKPWVSNISAVYGSTEHKAIDGAQILAAHLSIEHEMLDDLDEIDRSSTGYLPQREFRATVDAFFASPDNSIRGWETACEAQQRIVRAVETVVDHDTSDQDIAIVSHGGVGALHLCHLKGCEISRREGQPGADGGNYYCFDAQSGSLLHGWKPIDG